jgi:hypothetical protein
VELMAIGSGFYDLGALLVANVQWWDQKYAAADGRYNAAMNSRVGDPGNTEAVLWGKPIPITYGTRKVMGQPIQIGPRTRETVRNHTFLPFKESSGNFGYSTYTEQQTVYKTTFAVTFGAPGVPGSKQILTKLWINKRLVYDIDQANQSNTLDFHFYEGSEDQVADQNLNVNYEYPLAYRGLMYLVAYGYQHAASATHNFGENPIFEAMIVEQLSNNQTRHTYEQDLGLTVLYPQSTGFDKVTGIFYALGDDDRIHRYSVRERRLLDSVPITWEIEKPTNFHFYGKNMNLTRVGGVVYMFGQTDNSNSNTVYLIRADDGAVVDSAGVTSSSLTNSTTAISRINHMSVVEFSYKSYVYVTTIFNRVSILEIGPGSIDIIEAQTTDYGSDLSGVFGGGEFGFIADGTTIHLIRYKVREPNWYTTPLRITNAIYMPYDNSLVLFMVNPSDLTEWEIRKIHVETKETLWSRVAADYPSIVMPNLDSLNWCHKSYHNWTALGWQSNGIATNGIAVMNFISGVLNILDRDNTWSITNNIYDFYTNRMIAVSPSSTILDFKIIDPSPKGMQLDALLRDLARRQGYDDEDITVENLSDPIIGAAITQQADLNTMLDHLRIAFNFTIIKRGKTIRMSRRVLGSAFSVDATIYESDRAILSEDDDAFVTVESRRVAVQKVPGKVTINYIDPDLDYIQSNVTYTRNDAFADSASSLELTLPIIITASDALTLASRVGFDAVEGATEHEFLLSQRFSRLDQGDYVRLVFSEYEDVVRIDRIDFNGDKSIKCFATVVNFAPTVAYTLNPFPTPPPPVGPTLIEGPSTPLVFDVPLLTSSTSLISGNVRLMVGVVPAGRTPVTTAEIIRGKASDRQEVGVTPKVMTYGLLRETLRGTPWTIEYEKSLTFYVVQGDASAFTTKTVGEVLAGANRLLIGNTGRWELVGFLNASYDDDKNLMTLTGLVRGLRGTDVHVNDHTNGDYVILVDSALISDQMPISEIGEIYLYMTKGTSREYFEFGTAALIEGASRKPWAPANVKATRSSGDVVFTWQRRTRLNGPLNNGSATVPLDETTEKYEIDIYRAGSLVRTVTGITSPTYTYTASQQSTDGWSGDILSIRVDVYQISSEVGRGFANSRTHDVN